MSRLSCPSRARRAQAVFFLLCSLLLFTGCRPQPLYKDTHVLMGTFVEVTSTHPEAAEIVFEEFRRLEKILSIYDPRSEVSQLNRDGRVQAGPELMIVLSHAKRFWTLTDGAFDVTVAPLTELWGFSSQKYRVPEQEEIAEKLALVGMDKMVVRRHDSMIQFTLPGMQVNLGGIAKGFALDKAAQALRKHGIYNCLINAGGQVYALGEKAPGRSWKVARRDPRLPGGLSGGYLELTDQCVATSGGYEQYFEAGGKQYSHIIDPRSGYPVENDLFSVTVIASEGITADALATAVFVSGGEPAGDIREKFPGVEINKTPATHR
ncbi:MAG: FAD:protein FMN transferase [Candidatus Omnitrophica bacterium]|nr:FAD:protein FMN transferase [Candidatus Omnitrophota bacterium]